MKAFRVLLLFLFLSGCTSPQSYIDYDEQVNFSAIRSYNIIPELKSGLSELDQERLIRSLEAGFREEGLALDSNPDILVNVYSEEFQQQSGNSLGIGIGGTGRNVGVGISGGIPLGGPETFLSLTFDIIDAEQNELIWQAVVESRFDKNASPEKRQVAFDRMVAKALEDFPPK